MERIKKVQTFRLESTKEATRKKATTSALFTEDRQPKDGIYLAVPRTSSENRSYIPIAFLSADIIAANDIQLVENASTYQFGILTSAMHMAWMRVLCGRLKSDFRYSNKLVYNNYPWPAPLAAKERAAIEASAQAVLDARAAFPRSTLADLYDPLAMPARLADAHTALDRAVDRAYATAAGVKGSDPFPTDRARVEHLFALYEKLTVPLLPAVKPIRGRKPTGLYAKKPKEPPTGKATPESEAAASHFYISGKEDSPPYGTPAGPGADSPAPGDTPRTED
jgi:hypothetical protein